MTNQVNLNILDAAILAMGSPGKEMQLAGASILRLPAGAGRNYVKNLYESWCRVDVGLPPFNYQLAPRSRLGILPAWEIVDDVDVTQHLFRVALPTPGGRRELSALLGRIYAAPFDRSRPMWEMYLIEGLSGRRFAQCVKVHHALMDGESAKRLLMASMSEDRTFRDSQPPWAAATGHKSKRGASNAGGSSVPPATAKPRTARRLLNDITGLPGALASLRALGSDDVTAPRTILNGPITARRFTDSVVFDFARIRAAGRPNKSTVNDVSLAICGDALRRYLTEAGELPQDSLRAMVPVSLKTPGDAQVGNVLSAITVALGTNVADPLERLISISEATRAAKDKLRQATPQYVANLRGVVLTAHSAAQQFASIRRLDLAPYNLAISNVPGAPNKLYLNGAEMEQLVPNFMIADGMALSFLLVSYADQFIVTVTACPDTLPGIERISEMLTDSFAKLEAAQVKKADSRTRRMRRGTRKKRS